MGKFTLLRIRLVAQDPLPLFKLTRQLSLLVSDILPEIVLAGLYSSTNRGSRAFFMEGTENVEQFYILGTGI